tara:strand:+ start:712 stop:1029 length:318 start_codon:yes stop_codon:yes gene_type:complete
VVYQVAPMTENHKERVQILPQPPKKGIQMEVTLSEVKMIFSQEEDTAGRANELGQDLIIKMIDSGGGHYFVIETERWAIDKPEDLAKLLAYSKSTIDRFNSDVGL